MVIDYVEFTKVDCEEFEGHKFFRVQYSYGNSFGTIHLDDCNDNKEVKLCEIHKTFGRNNELGYVCKVITDNLKVILKG